MLEALSSSLSTTACHHFANFWLACYSRIYISHCIWHLKGRIHDHPSEQLRSKITVAHETQKTLRDVLCCLQLSRFRGFGGDILTCKLFTFICICRTGFFRGYFAVRRAKPKRKIRSNNNSKETVKQLNGNERPTVNLRPENGNWSVRWDGVSVNIR